MRRIIADIKRSCVDDHGMVTVEGAYSIAAIVTTVVIGVGAVAGTTVQVRCTDAAREAARLAAIGDASAVQVATRIAGDDARISLQDSGSQVVAEVRDDVPLLPAIELSARAVAAKEPESEATGDSEADRVVTGDDDIEAEEPP
ncbi:TadE family type IV pilus minor pilin [Gordonia sp. PKS22-38]|uniref:TadE family type IV pilus minor pilin n=1 Tax=Gordonia prachuapensis TaxID=3115651 RepID=A0ABU7MXE7_9ACTN|nr:TadE family type IV pilus minor pilin [Gordonia sp. PKS22-38]